MRTDGMDALRTALRAFGTRSVTAAQLGDALGLQTENERQIMRKRMHRLMKTGEMEKLSHGQYRYLPEKAPRRQGESYTRVWKIVRIQPPGWKKQTVSALSRISRTVVDRYVNWMETEGFVERAGNEGKTVLWRTTAKGREQRETPWPPLDIPDAYTDERAATARLCTLMLTGDLDAAYIREKIRAQLNILARRFCSQVENTQETQGESHV